MSTEPDGDDNDVPPHVLIQREILDNAAKTQGADFANYAACVVELAQIGAILTRLEDRETEAARAKKLAAMAKLLLHSIDSKIFDQLTTEQRIEAGKCATRVIQAVEAAGG